MLLLNLLMGLFMMDSLEFIRIQQDDPGPNYEDTREFYSVGSLKNANNESSFIKLAFVVDNDLYTKLYEDNSTVSRYCQNILWFANSLFQSYNIFIALVDIIIWAKRDEIYIDTQYMYFTQTRFETYVRDFLKKNHSIDYTVLLSPKVGQGAFCKYTSFENVDKKCDMVSRTVMRWESATQLDEKYDAWRLINLLSLSIGIAKDENTGQCFNNKGFESEVMKYLSNPTIYEMKPCTDKFMKKIAETSRNFSGLKTKPNILYKKPVCGNNVTEPEEECDCKWLSWSLQDNKNVECDNQCCNATTCHRRKTYSYHWSCAFGECCDLNSCTKTLKKKQICRPASHPCDVAEYCDGKAAFCPRDIFVNDSRECSVKECHNAFMDDGVLFCQGTTEYKGVCNSEGLCQHKMKTSSPICKNSTTDTSTTVRSDFSTSSKFYGPDSQLTSITTRSNSSTCSKCDCPDPPFLDLFQWKTYFYLTIVLVLIGIIFSSRMKKYYLRFRDQTQPQGNHNSSLRNGMINEGTPTINEDNQRLTATTPSSFQMDSLGHREHEYDELNTASNIYAKPYQQGESTSSHNRSNQIIYAKIAFPPPARAT